MEQIGERQGAFLRVMLAALREDADVRAVFLKGSLGNDTGDEYSDVDLYCVVADGTDEVFLGRRRSLLERYRPILFWADVNFVAPQVVAIFNDGLHVDLYTLTAGRIASIASAGGMAKALHDPEGLLTEYQPAPMAITLKDVVHHFDDFGFVVVELEAAIGREDTIWARHLLDALAVEIGFVYRYLHDRDHSRLSLKHIDRVMDNETRGKMIRAAEAPVAEAVRLYCAIMREIGMAYPAADRAAFNWTFFEFMAARAAG